MDSHHPGEFDLIKAYFTNIGRWPDDVLSGQDKSNVEIGDDCAVLTVPSGYQLCFSIDTLVSGVHFPFYITPENLATRALAVCLSDVLAMGALPWCFTLAISLPESNRQWLQAFSDSLNQAARHYGIRLVGGDTTKGSLTLSIQVQGLLPIGRGLFRHKAKVGDHICVTGCLGDAAGALNFLDAPICKNAHIQALLDSYYRPKLPLDKSLCLINSASCAIDVSDGLLADLKHITDASKVGGVIFPECIPLSKALLALLPEKALDLAMTGGDDYQLIVCIPDLQSSVIDQLGLHVVGQVVSEEGIFIRQPNGEMFEAEVKGYQHF